MTGIFKNVCLCTKRSSFFFVVLRKSCLLVAATVSCSHGSHGSHGGHGGIAVMAVMADCSQAGRSVMPGQKGDGTRSNGARKEIRARPGRAWQVRTGWTVQCVSFPHMTTPSRGVDTWKMWRTGRPCRCNLFSDKGLRRWTTAPRGWKSWRSGGQLA